MNERQTELPFNRREINRLIERAELPSPRRGVIRSVLKEIVFYLANKPDGTSGPTLDELAKTCGWSKRTIQRAIRDAETLGVLSIEPTIGRDGRKASRYTVNRPALGGYGTADQLAWDGRHGGQGQVTPCHLTVDTVSPDSGHRGHAYKEETSKEPVKPVRPKAPKARISIDDIQIPPSMDTPQLRAALHEWLDYHAKRARATYRSGDQLTHILERIERDHGHNAARVATESIETAIGANYQGFYWGKKGNHHANHGMGPGQVYRPGHELGDI